MKVLFITYHPVDPFITFQLAENLMKKGGECFYAIVEKEGIIEDIISSRGHQYKVLAEAKKSFNGKILNSIQIVKGIRTIIRNFKPDLVFSPAAPYSSLALRFSNIPLICWEDTETANFNYRFSIGRIDSLLITESFYRIIKSDKVVKFNGYKELAYLHPKIFSPDDEVLKDLGISENDTIVLMRFSALYAMHDIGLESKVTDNENKILDFIKKIESLYNAKVFISVTERDPGKSFDQYKLRIHPSKYMHLLNYCSLYIGEGTTTACEAGVLGVPWIALRNEALGYLNDQEYNYKLGFRINDLDKAFEKAEEILQEKNLKERWRAKRDVMIQEKIDVTAFLEWFLTNYPKSLDTMRKNNRFQDTFK